jgi:hypothetical protein
MNRIMPIIIGLGGRGYLKEDTRQGGVLYIEGVRTGYYYCKKHVL